MKRNSLLEPRDSRELFFFFFFFFLPCNHSCVDGESRGSATSLPSRLLNKLKLYEEEMLNIHEISIWHLSSIHLVSLFGPETRWPGNKVPMPWLLSARKLLIFRIAGILPKHLRDSIYYLRSMITTDYPRPSHRYNKRKALVSYWMHDKTPTSGCNTEVSVAHEKSQLLKRYHSTAGLHSNQSYWTALDRMR